MHRFWSFGSRSCRMSMFSVLTGFVVIASSHAAIAQCYDCPTPNPIHETGFGWNLYWNDPYRCENENCLPNTCPASATPTWYASAELLPLFRDESGDVIFQRDGTTGLNAITAGEFDSEFNAGGRFVLGRSLGDWYRLEASYVGSYEWDDTIVVRNTDPITDPAQGGIGNLYSPFSNFGSPLDANGNPSGITDFDYNLFASTGFSSKMENVEINLRRRVRLLTDLNLRRRSIYNQGEPYVFQKRAELSFLVGVRYMKLEERLAYLTRSNIPAGSANVVDVGADNDMIGAQLGLLSQFLVLPRTWVDFEIKGVLFQNRVDVRSSYLNTNNGGGNFQFTGADQRDRTAYLGELSLMFNHQFTRTITFRAGYTAMWVSQLALASQNMPPVVQNPSNQNIRVGPVLANHTGDLVYHGPSLGLVFAY